MPWWLENNLRLVQNNLRDIDAAMDVDRLLSDLRQFDCNVVMVGAGGITSFFPTELAYQRPSPFLGDRDVLGEIVEKCHQEGIRVIARFDFSKTHESFYKDHPEWYYRSPKGEIVRYNDTVHTCVCGWYQQEYSLKIIEEVLQKYSVDGIFFNMFGFTTSDYSNNYYGICHCDACRQKFAAYSGGMDLPERESPEDPTFQTYRDFQDQVVGDILRRIHKLVRQYSPEIAVCTYHHSDVDIIRNESNSAVDRPLPFWLYNSSSNVAMVRQNWNNKIISNCVINAADIFYRFSAVPPELTKIRLYENMAAGSGLDFCIIGVFEDYHDQESVDEAKKVFHFHKLNEDIYGKLRSLARLAVIHPLSRHCGKDFYGVFRALKELHLPFDCLADQRILEDVSLLEPYVAVLVPSLSDIQPEAVLKIQKMGKKLMILGAEPLTKGLQESLGLKLREIRADNRAAYLYTKEKNLFPSMEKRDWMLLDGSFNVYEGKGWRSLLPRVEKAWFGPPERCFGHILTEEGGTLFSSDDQTVVIPWGLGSLYHKIGYREYRDMLRDILRKLAPEVEVIGGNLPAAVEVFWDKVGNQYLLQLLNLTGFHGNTMEKPLCLTNLKVELCGSFILARSLTGGTFTVQSNERGKTFLSLQKLTEFEAILLESNEM